MAFVNSEGAESVGEDELAVEAHGSCGFVWGCDDDCIVDIRDGHSADGGEVVVVDGVEGGVKCHRVREGSKGTSLPAAHGAGGHAYGAVMVGKDLVRGHAVEVSVEWVERLGAMSRTGAHVGLRSNVLKALRASIVMATQSGCESRIVCTTVVTTSVPLGMPQPS